VNLHAHSQPLTAAGSGFRITPSAFGMHRLELWDVMPVGWLGHFTRAVSSRSVDIVSGVALRGEHARWTARLDVQGATSAELSRIDFLALAHEVKGDFTVPPLALRTFELTRSGDAHDALVLKVRAADKIGFLASLLEHLAGLVLFPEQIRIDTFQREAQDVLWLSSVGGQPPGPEIEAALRASLLACLRERPSLLPGK